MKLFKKKEKLKQEIARLVNKYPWPDSKDLFRAELEYLVSQTQQETLAWCLKEGKRLVDDSTVRTSKLECSQDGYEYGVEDLIQIIKNKKKK